MSNLNFKNPFEMTHDELLNYVADLENRIANANRGALVFRDEANSNRAEVLAWKEIAEQYRENVNALADIAQRKVSGMADTVTAAEAVCHTWTDYTVALRMIQHQIEGICRWLNVQTIPPQEYLTASPEVDDIPF